MKRILFLLACVGVLFCSGCASTSGTVAPNIDLNRIKSVYVQHLPADGRGVDRIIADQLNLMGYKASTGTRDPAAQIDAVLTYQDKWMWDITMYMIELNVQLRDPKTETALATARSYRPSLQRKSPPEMAKEVLETLFKKTPAGNSEK
jgi:hypothetical protein